MQHEHVGRPRRDTEKEEDFSGTGHDEPVPRLEDAAILLEDGKILLDVASIHMANAMILLEDG